MTIPCLHSFCGLFFSNMAITSFVTSVTLIIANLWYQRIPFKLECNQIWDIEAVNFLIYFSVRQNSKKESKFHVNVHTISLRIVFSKSSLNPKFTILPLRSVCRSQDEFYHPKILGVSTAFGYYSLSDRAKKSYFFPGDKS